VPVTFAAYLKHLNSGLSRVGYRPYLSGIRLNAECPNLLIKRRLAETIKKALREKGRKIHLIGHSLGGMMARSIAAQRPDDIASVNHAGCAIPRQGGTARCDAGG